MTRDEYLVALRSLGLRQVGAAPVLGEIWGAEVARWARGRRSSTKL